MTIVPRQPRTRVRGRERGQLPQRRASSELEVIAQKPKPGEHDPTLRPPEDRYYVMSLLGQLAGDACDIAVTTIYGNPHSKRRPIIARGRAMPDAVDVKAEAGTRAVLERRHTRYTGNVALVCIFFRPNKQRIDADNMLKHVCDAANGLLWDDDSQVTTVLGIVEYDAGLPRTVVGTAPQRTSMLRGSDDVLDCGHCGSEYRRSNMNKYCSPKCSHAARGQTLKGTPVVCEYCEEDFVRTTTAQRYCSPECRIEGRRGKFRGRAKPNSRCSSCDKQLAHKRGGRCRECWRSSP